MNVAAILQKVFQFDILAYETYWIFIQGTRHVAINNMPSLV